MDRHEHKECEHKLDYCKVCRVAYCKLCGKQWYEYVYYPYYQTVWSNLGEVYTNTGNAPSSSDIKVSFSHSH
jgi:hypothetical protein